MSLPTGDVRAQSTAQTQNSAQIQNLFQPENISSLPIRLRLIVAFIVAVLLPFAGISLVLTISEWQGGQRAAVTQLETVAPHRNQSRPGRAT
jgi:hypothetical protein